MKLTAGKVFAVFPVLTAIINEKRVLPMKGAYRVARMAAKLQAEYQIVAEKRDAIILAYDHKAFPAGITDEVAARVKPAPEKVPTVPPDKVEDFAAKVGELFETEIEVEVQPIPLSQLDLGDGQPSQITAAELVALGELVVDDTEVAKAAA